MLKIKKHRHRTKLVLAVPLLLTAGCLQPYRASSVDHLGLQASTIVVPLTRDESVRAVTDRLAQRGFQRYDQFDGPEGSLLTFYRGERRTLSDVVDTGLGIETRSSEIGSWFGVRFIPRGEGTEVFFLGTPTLNGAALCSSSDSELSAFQYWCVDSRVRSDWTGLRLITGREEADTVRGVILELGELVRPSGPAVPPTPEPQPSAPEPTTAPPDGGPEGVSSPAEMSPPPSTSNPG